MPESTEPKVAKKKVTVADLQQQVQQLSMLVNNIFQQLDVFNATTLFVAKQAGIKAATLKYLTAEDTIQFLHQEMRPFVDSAMKLQQEANQKLREEAEDARKEQESKEDSNQ